MLSTKNKTISLLAAAAAFTALATQSAFAQKKYDTGASDTEIKIGNVEAYSGPASAYGVIGKTEEAYFKMINDNGGVNGRKINFISYDDGYSPPKTVEQIRKLIESDEVFLVFNALGTPTQTAVQKYQNNKKVPQLFVATGASKWDDPKDFPWTMGFQPSYRVEARIFAKYILKEKPNAKVAVFYQNDDFGKDYVAGLKEVFGDKASSLIVAEESYETTEPSIDSHIVKLKGTGADVFVNIATPKFAAQAIKKMAELEWKPMHLMTDVSISIGAVMKPAGLEASEGVLSATYLKDASDPQWKDDAGMKKFMAFVEKYMPGANISDANMVYGYAAAQTMVQVLQQCGDNLTRENVMKQAASLKNFAADTLIPGITVSTSPTDFAPIQQLKMIRFTKGQWDLFGDIISAEAGG
jgi:ABC-type branched-subunit amino acid transport system substrate-binding protein